MFGAQPIALHAIEIPRCCAIVYSMTIKMITTDASNLQSPCDLVARCGTLRQVQPDLSWDGMKRLNYQTDAPRRRVGQRVK